MVSVLSVWRNVLQLLSGISCTLVLLQFLYFMCIFYLIKEYYNEVLYLKYLFMFSFLYHEVYMMCNYTNGGIKYNKLNSYANRDSLDPNPFWKWPKTTSNGAYWGWLKKWDKPQDFKRDDINYKGYINYCWLKLIFLTVRPIVYYSLFE